MFVCFLERFWLKFKLDLGVGSLKAVQEAWTCLYMLAWVWGVRSSSKSVEKRNPKPIQRLQGFILTPPYAFWHACFSLAWLITWISYVYRWRSSLPSSRSWSIMPSWSLGLWLLCSIILITNLILVEDTPMESLK